MDPESQDDTSVVQKICKDEEEDYVEVKIEPDLIFNQENSSPRKKSSDKPQKNLHLSYVWLCD